STQEPESPEPYLQTDWKKTADLLNIAFGAYLDLFWPNDEEVDDLSQEWKRVREVAMPAFIQYFNTGLIANPDQVRARILNYLGPFGNLFVDAGIITPLDALRVADWIGGRLERGLGAFNAVMDDLEQVQKWARLQ